METLNFTTKRKTNLVHSYYNKKTKNELSETNKEINLAKPNNKRKQIDSDTESDSESESDS